MNDRVANWPRGKVLGGCSSINAMIWVRGDPGISSLPKQNKSAITITRNHVENYDAWERAGCKGWSYEDVLPYFKKCENCEVPQTEDKWRGRDGILSLFPYALSHL